MKSASHQSRIGILGGSFDPIHIGHLKLALAARKFLKLDQVIFIPSYISPFKKQLPITPGGYRLAMVRLATRRFPWARVSNVELKRKGISYAVDTLKQIRRIYGKPALLFLILGSDAFKLFPKWRHSGEILRLAQIAVAHRSGTKNCLAQIPYVRIPMKEVNVSASEIRRQFARGKSPQKALPALILDYIGQNHLYFQKKSS